MLFVSHGPLPFLCEIQNPAMQEFAPLIGAVLIVIAALFVIRRSG